MNPWGGAGEPLGQPDWPPGSLPSGGASVPEPSAAVQQEQHGPQQGQQHQGRHAHRQPGSGPVLIQRRVRRRGLAGLPQGR